MQLKLSSAIPLLSLATVVALGDAATTTAAPESSGGGSLLFSPPPSTTCLAANFATGGDFLDCCPAADPNDGICTIIWCVNPEDLSLRDDCACEQVEAACKQLSMFTSAVDGLSEACTAMDGCCETGVTSNSDFASCTEDAVAMSNITIPDIHGLVPGGVPNLDSVTATASDTETATTTAATEAGATEEGTTEQNNLGN